MGVRWVGLWLRLWRSDRVCANVETGAGKSKGQRRGTQGSQAPCPSEAQPQVACDQSIPNAPDFRV